MVADQAFALRDGFYCIVNGRVFGTWDTLAIAEAGMKVEQRQHAAGIRPDGVLHAGIEAVVDMG